MKTLVTTFVLLIGLASFNSWAITDLADLTGESLKPDCPRTHDTAVQYEEEKMVLDSFEVTEPSSDDLVEANV